jgi:apolipoprotein N-acyltransferase
MVRPPQKDDLWAAVSGLLLALSFPVPGWWFLAWFALVPWLLTMRQRPFRSGCVAGGIFFAVVLYWVNIVMTRYGGLPLVLSLVAYLLLVAYLALYFGLVSWVSIFTSRHLRVSPLAAFPLFWVAAEYGRAHLLTGFPWALLGYSQHPCLPLIQSAEVWGVYGLGLLIVICNLLIARAWHAAAESAGALRIVWPLLVATLVLAGNGLYGALRLHTPADVSAPNLRVGLVQGNIDQGVKWDPAYQNQTLKKYVELTAAATRQPVDLVIWPESATPLFFQEQSPQANLVRNVPVRTGAALLFGSPAYQRQDHKIEYFNSAFLLSPQGRVLGRSDKVHLVPFGEYVPLKWLLPFVDKLVVGIGDFSPGKLLPLDMGDVQLGVLVCYEVIFPGLARAYIDRGADLLVNITNDAWFGKSSAPYQHLAMAAFRAVENRVWIARAANTGITAFIDPFGKVLDQTELYTDSYRVASLVAQAAPGFYSRHGDLLPQASVLFSLILLALAFIRKKRGI